MIIISNTVDTIMRKAVSPSKLATNAVVASIKQLGIDPTVMNPPRDAYIFSSDDVKNQKVKKQLTDALEHKHPNVKVIFIEKNGKKLALSADVPGIDGYIIQPQPKPLADLIGKILSGDVSDVLPVDSQVVDRISDLPPAVTEEYVPPVIQEPEPEPEPEPIEEPVVELPEPPVVEEQPVFEQPVDVLSPLAQQIEAAPTVAEVSVLTREITSTELIKEMLKTNSSYAQIEERLQTINDQIFQIMHDESIPTLEAKMNKIRSIVHDKEYWLAKGNTLLEERIELLVDTICRCTSEKVEARLDEINVSLNKIRQVRQEYGDNARLGGLNEERINIIIELRNLENDIQNIFTNTDEFINDSTLRITQSILSPCNNDWFDAHLKAAGSTVISEETLNVIKSVLSISEDKITEQFKTLLLKVVTMIQLCNKLLELDKEIIVAQAETIKYLKAHKVEDTVIAETLLKKALRVFVSTEGNGTSIVPYLISQRQSRMNANVLLVDITGYNKLDSYGISSISMEDLYANSPQEDFVIAQGYVDNDTASIQMFYAKLMELADHYRIINVVMDSAQLDILNSIFEDSLVVNYICTPDTRSIKATKEVIDNITVKNTAQRLIINKCDVAISPIINKLDLQNRLDFQVLSIPTIPAIVDATLYGYDPCDNRSVIAGFNEVAKYVKS